MSIYYFYKRFDVIETFLKRGAKSADFGELLLPSFLLITGLLSLFIKSKKNKKNEI